MKYVVVFGTLSAALLFNALESDVGWLKALLLSVAICFAGVSLAFAGAGPKIFLKSNHGRLSFFSWVIFWPYHSLNFLSLVWFRRRARGEGALWTEIQSDLWLGTCLNETDAKQWLREHASILDVAGELSETRTFREAAHYRSLPTLDRYPPSFADLRDGAKWITNQLEAGPVYVHCALGHGRSATFVAAHLLLTGKVSSIDEAVTLLKSHRARVDLSTSQIQALEKLLET